MDSLTQKNKWHFLAEPYMMFPNMKGTMGLGNLPDASVDENPGDIFSHLQIGAMLYAEAYNGEWAITSDMLYMKLGEDISQSNLIHSGHVTAKQLGWELAALRKFLPWLEAGFGATLNSIKADLGITLNTSGNPSRSNNLNKTWVDPSVIVRAKFPFSSKWSLQARGNIGGFGIGSKFAWQAQVYVGYRLSKLLLLSAGYRAIGMDYDKGIGQDRFLYDVTTFGPVLRFGFNF